MLSIADVQSQKSCFIFENLISKLLQVAHQDNYVHEPHAKRFRSDNRRLLQTCVSRDTSFYWIWNSKIRLAGRKLQRWINHRSFLIWWHKVNLQTSKDYKTRQPLSTVDLTSKSQFYRNKFHLVRHSTPELNLHPKGIQSHIQKTLNFCPTMQSVDIDIHTKTATKENEENPGRDKHSSKNWKILN